MKTKYLCECCGGSKYKSLTSPLSFKYGSTVTVPCYKCCDCGEIYAVVPTMFSIILEQAVCIIIPLFLSWLFFREFPPPYGTQPYKLGLLLDIIMLALPLYGVMITAWNYLKCFFAVRPVSFTLVHIDENYVPIVNKDEHADYSAEVTVSRKQVSKIKEGTVYKCTVNNKQCVVKLIDLDLTGERLILKLKSVNIPEGILNDPFALYNTGGKKIICSGTISKKDEN